MTTPLHVGLFSVDPPSLGLFRFFDPDSFMVLPAIVDALVVIDGDGRLLPALATSWAQISPTCVEFELRRGVRFHNGEPFDADAVLATFQAHREPTPSAAMQVVFWSIASVEKVDAFRVRIHTVIPDAMLFHRLFFGGIYPPGLLAARGRDWLDENPVGTGAYELVRYERGRVIELRRNPDHWARAATVDRILLPILRQKEWVHRLGTGELDVALGLDAHDAQRAAKVPGIRTGSREADLAQWFLLTQRGPLADVRVRRALNHAIHRRVLVDITEHGAGRPQASAIPPVGYGFADPEPYRYSPELARRMLEEAGFGGGFTLRGIVCETSTALFFAVREFLARVGVHITAEIVPRAEVFAYMAQRGAGRDFVVLPCDNPLLHGLFLMGAFFSPQAPYAIFGPAAEFQSLLERATVAVDDPLPALAELDRYHQQHAMMLFTVTQHAHAAWREGVEVALPRSGHFDAAAFWGLRADPRALAATPPTAPAAPPVQDIERLLRGTSHTGAFFLGAEARFDHPATERIWLNLLEAQDRWHAQSEPMTREIVNALEARTNLASVLRSTERVAIAAYTPERRPLFSNRGFELMFGEGRSLFDWLPPGFDEAVQAAVVRDGAWAGRVHLSGQGRPPGAPTELLLHVTPVQDDDGFAIGSTFVLSDFSGEEERIKTAATRTILDNVPYGLFMVGRDGRLRDGYSSATVRIFGTGADLAGRRLTELFALSRRDADHFDAAFEQVFDDIFPPEVALGQLPERLLFRGKTWRLDGSVVRDDAGAVDAVLFTCADISALAAAEHEAAHHKATSLLLRFRGSFEPFARGFVTQLRALAARDASPQADVRAALHSAKGAFGQFSLVALAQRVHELEELDPVPAEALVDLADEVTEALGAHGVDVRDATPRYVVRDDALQHLDALVRTTSDPVALRRSVLEALDRLRSRSASEWMEPIAAAAAAQAERRGKLVDVRLTGGETAVPARLGPVFDTVGHLVRNAVDHGIEVDRADKPATGRIDVRVRADDDALWVEVADDGRGLDLDRLVDRAVAQGVIPLERARTLTDDERAALVFADRLSTADVVTDTSGRGVGMGAVRAEVERAGGTVRVTSRFGHGTVVTVHLPLRTATGTPMPGVRRVSSVVPRG